MVATDAEVEVLAVEQHSLPYYSLTLRAPRAWAETAPGQFLMVRVGELLEPFLRRAFSIHDASSFPAGGARIELLAKIVGRGTRLLAACRPGQRLRVLGPLGRPFTLVPEGPVALVAGGVGSAPLLLLARHLRTRGLAFDFFYGGRSAEDLPRRELFAELAAASGGMLIATTEDGTAGEKGLVTEPLAWRLERGAYRFVYGCGPMGLLARLAELAARHGVPGEAALETAMGCGFGACLGCAVPVPGGRYALCCKDGPVFPFDGVRW